MAAQVCHARRDGASCPGSPRPCRGCSSFSGQVGYGTHRVDHARRPRRCVWRPRSPCRGGSGWHGNGVAARLIGWGDARWRMGGHGWPTYQHVARQDGKQKRQTPTKAGKRQTRGGRRGLWCAPGGSCSRLHLSVAMLAIIADFGSRCLTMATRRCSRFLPACSPSGRRACNRRVVLTLSAIRAFQQTFVSGASHALAPAAWRPACHALPELFSFAPPLKRPYRRVSRTRWQRM